jgi:hypothetical protein
MVSGPQEYPRRKQMRTSLKTLTVAAALIIGIAAAPALYAQGDGNTAAKPTTPMGQNSMPMNQGKMPMGQGKMPMGQGNMPMDQSKMMGMMKQMTKIHTDMMKQMKEHHTQSDSGKKS